MSENTPENNPADISESIPEESPKQHEPELQPELQPVSQDVQQQPAQAEESSKIPGQGAVRSVFLVLAGWFVPGLAHLLQRRIGRAMVGFAAVGAMSVAGLWMRGNIFPPHWDDAFGALGFIADAGAGVFYVFAHTLEKAGPDVSRAIGDYGTRLVATAGVLNLLFVLDALEISRGHKN